MSKPFIGLYLKTSDLLTDQGPAATLSLYRRAVAAGYPDILAWDNMHSRPQPNADYPEARELQKAVADNGGRVIVQTAYTGRMVADALGDSSVLEHGAGGDDAVICFADPRVLPLWIDQAKRLNDWWPDAAGVLLSYDELRAQGSHPACRAYSGRFGELLAAHAKAAIAAHRSVNPNWHVLCWNDMFDPAVNAGPGDYRNVRGGWSGSWEGIDKDVVIANWSTNGNDEQAASWPWWAARGNRMLYHGYYDYGNNDYNDGISPQDEKDWIGRSIDAAPGLLCGYVYTTWQGNYSKIRDYYPGPDLLTRMAPFPAGGTVTPPTPPTPDPVPVPPPTPDPLAADLAEMDGLIERVQTRGIRAKQRVCFARIKAGIAAKNPAA